MQKKKASKKLLHFQGNIKSNSEQKVTHRSQPPRAGEGKHSTLYGDVLGIFLKFILYIFFIVMLRMMGNVEFSLKY